MPGPWLAEASVDHAPVEPGIGRKRNRTGG